MESINMALIVHCINNPEQSLLIDQQWEVSNPILLFSNLQNLPVLFLSNLEELTVRFCIWESGLPLCIFPQVFHFPELVVGCADNFSTDSNSIVIEQLSQILITISRETIIKMVCLHTTRFSKQNMITVSQEILVQNFTSATPQVQLAFIQGIQRPRYVTPTL